jgi:WD40 repeat protein
MHSEQHVNWGVPISGGGIRTHWNGIASSGRLFDSGGATSLLDTPTIQSETQARVIAIQEAPPHFGPVTALTVPYHASWVVSGSQGGSLYLNWLRPPIAYRDAYANSKVAFLNRSITALTVSTEGRYAVSACEDGTVRLWDAIESFRGEPNTVDPRLIEAAQLAVQGAIVRSVAWWTNNFCVDWLLTGGEDGIARIIRVKTGEEELRFNHEMAISQVHWSDGGRMIFTVGGGACRLWKTDTGEELEEFRFRPEHGIEHLIPWFFDSGGTSSGATLVYSDDQHNVRIFDLITKEYYNYAHHEGKVTSLGIRDDTYIVSASEDATVRVCDVESVHEPLKLENESPVTSALSFGRGNLSSRDTDYLLTGAADGRWRVWDYGQIAQ